MGSSILLCLPSGLWSGSESSCRGMQTADSHCLLIALLDFLDLNFNGPVKFFVSFNFIDHRPQKEKIIGHLKSELPSSIDHIIINYPLYVSFMKSKEQRKALPGKEMYRLSKPQILSSKGRVPRRVLECLEWGL